MKETLASLCKFTAVKSPAAIMSSVRITPEFAYATDGPSSMRVMWDGPDCDIAISAPQLSAALAGLPDDQHLKLVADANFATLHAGRRKYKLRTVPVDGMPEIEVKGEPKFKPAGPLADAIKYALTTAAVTSIVRPEYCGALVDQTMQGTHVIGLDGYRANLMKVDDEQGNFRSLIPRALAARIVALAKFGGEIGFTEDRVIFRKGESTFIGVLGEAHKYPAWQKIMRPDESKMFEITGSQASILAAAEDAKRFGIDTIVMVASGQGLTITGRNNGDEIEHQIDIDYNGPEIELGVNPSYLVDAIQSTGGWPTISISTPASGLPILLKLGDRVGIVQKKRL